MEGSRVFLLLLSLLFLIKTWFAGTLAVGRNSLADEQQRFVLATNGDMLLTFRSQAPPEFFVARVNTLGHLVWGKEIGDGGGENDYAMSMMETRTGEIILTGFSTSLSGDSGNSGFVMKMSSDGNILWTKYITSGTLVAAAELPNGNYVVTGNMVVLNAYEQDCVFAILASNGDLVEGVHSYQSNGSQECDSIVVASEN